MVNDKMYELGTKKSTIRTIFEYGRKRAAEVGEEHIYDFSLGNPNVPTPEFVKEAAIDILNNTEPSAVHGYTVAPGNPQVRAVIAKSINQRFGTSYTAQNLFITSGADGKLNYLGAYDIDLNDPAIAHYAREASHRILYTVANSKAMNGAMHGSTLTGTPTAKVLQTVLTIVCLVLLALLVFFTIRRFTRKPKTVA